jgi:predicted nucleotidyltransferase component of viral defense system
MTAKVIDLLDELKSQKLFERYPLYFVGGTALAYYLNHRISEDIDILGTAPLPYREIIQMISTLGGTKIQDANAMSLRLAGLFPEEHMLKFHIGGVKVEFFTASTPQQKEIMHTAMPTSYENGSLNILDLPSIAKLKLIALLNRRKSRDLYDFKTILEKNTLKDEEILLTASGANKQVDSMARLYAIIEKMHMADDDEMVYLNEKDPSPIHWDEIKKEVLWLLGSKL